LSGPEGIIAMAERHEGRLTLVCVGPLTNLAIALSLRPRLTRQIANVIVMGGAFFTAGNITPHAEFNIYVDPDAAQQVFAAPWQAITAIGLDVTHQTTLSRAIWEGIAIDASGAARLLRDIGERTFTERQMSGLYLHDPLALATALDPSLVGGDLCEVDVVTQGEERGKTTTRAGGSVLVATLVDAERFVRRFCDALGIGYIDDPAALVKSE
jgi:inosine-uridine nucleoside N-ribohydrolase